MKLTIIDAARSSSNKAVDEEDEGDDGDKEPTLLTARVSLVASAR